MERRACPYHTGLACKREERGRYKEEERKEGGSVCESVYQSPPVLDSTSRWAGNEAEDTH